MKLHSTILGEGQPILILHGFLGMSDNWKTLGNEFSEAGFQVHLIDQRNHGRSPHSEVFNYTELAKDVKEYIENYSLKNVILIGHSMGGKSAMTAAALFPHLIDKLVVVDIAPKYYAPHHQQILEGLKAVDDATLNSRGDADEVLAKHVPEKAVRMFLLKNLYWKQKERLGLRLNLEVLTKEIEELGQSLPNDYTFTKPTLFIKGERSNYITSEDEGLIKKHFPNATLSVISRAGHWVHAENKKEFYEQVMKFLSI
ncbi:alpha/beta fold hydrolase [Salinimicrobium sp. MT39]|uniref:Alpha/beta fold hydrolase n=1 Tax=Salinimicrobium profundisediminis TaxID=2994553 RepID=A0A9X3I0S8_9FLAO|nr:alpha/beta fold hydrolase [Salinimicrobium profundisediminis]MCX2837232.1 alpha/beta fold hydrolase [Salinimicrobium profundisediminis]